MIYCWANFGRSRISDFRCGSAGQAFPTCAAKQPRLQYGVINGYDIYILVSCAAPQDFRARIMNITIVVVQDMRRKLATALYTPRQGTASRARALPCRFSTSTSPIPPRSRTIACFCRNLPNIVARCHKVQREYPRPPPPSLPFTLRNTGQAADAELHSRSTEDTCDLTEHLPGAHSGAYSKRKLVVP
jgi:hypothetical protein